MTTWYARSLPPITGTLRARGAVAPLASPLVHGTSGPTRGLTASGQGKCLSQHWPRDAPQREGEPQ